MVASKRKNEKVSKNKDQIQAVIDELELAVMSDKVDMSHFDDFYVPAPLDAAIWALAEVEPRNLTLHEVFDKLDDSVVDTEFGYEPHDSDFPMIIVLSELYKVWADFDGIAVREDNVLNWERNSTNWKIGYKKALAGLISTHGVPVALVPSYYSWGDYNLQIELRENPVPDEVIAVFNVKEDSWNEFNGTFATEDDSHSGMVADVVYSSGISRKVRYEGSLGEIMNKL